MISGLKPYPTYREVDDPWLTRLPEHWKLNSLRQCGRIVGGLTPNMSDRTFWDGVIPWVTPKDMKRPIIADSLIRVTDEALRRTSLRLVPSGSLLLVVRGMILARRVPVACTVAPVTINQDMKAMTFFPGITAGYVRGVLESAGDAFAPLIDEAGHGTRRLPTERWREIRIPVPPEAEQTSILRFLDHADRRISRFVRTKQRLLALLSEQKQAIVHHAITTAVDSAAQIAAPVLRRRTFRLKDVAIVQTGLTLGKTYPSALTQNYPYLRVANVQTGHVNLETIAEIHVPEIEANRVTLRSGDVLMTEGGDIDKLGRGCVWHGEIPQCLHQNHVFAVRCDTSQLLPDYLAALTASPYGREYFQTTAKQTTNLAATNSTTLKAFSFPLPPVSKQKAIVQRISHESATLDALSKRAEREIALLREYRTRLIADVVTGKLDVREAAARLPDEPDDDIPDDDALKELDPDETGSDSEEAQEDTAE